MSDLFITYDAQDGGAMAQHIIRALITNFGAERVRTPHHRPPPNISPREALQQAIASAKVVVVILGRERNGEMSLRNPSGAQFISLTTALHYHKPILPVLVYGGVMPLPEQLPPQLQPVAYLNALNVRDVPDFQADMNTLITAIQQRMPPVPQSVSPPAPAPYPTPAAPPPQQPASASTGTGRAAGNLASATGRGIFGIVGFVIGKITGFFTWLAGIIIGQVVKSTVSFIMFFVLIGLFVAAIAFFGVNLLQNDLNISQTITAISTQLSDFIQSFSGNLPTAP